MLGMHTLDDLQAQKAQGRKHNGNQMENGQLVTPAPWLLRQREVVGR
jgi:hypothetical protein